MQHKRKQFFTGNTHDVGSPHATHLGKQTRQAGRSGLTTVTSVWLQSGSFPSCGSSLQNAWVRDFRKLGLGFQPEFFCDQGWVCFASSIIQLLRAWDKFFSEQKYQIPLPHVCFGILVHWEWLNSLYWFLAPCLCSPSQPMLNTYQAASLSWWILNLRICLGTWSGPLL